MEKRLVNTTAEQLDALNPIYYDITFTGRCWDIPMDKGLTVYFPQQYISSTANTMFTNLYINPYGATEKGAYVKFDLELQCALNGKITLYFNNCKIAQRVENNTDAYMGGRIFDKNLELRNFDNRYNKYIIEIIYDGNDYNIYVSANSSLKYNFQKSITLGLVGYDINFKNDIYLSGSTNKYTRLYEQQNVSSYLDFSNSYNPEYTISGISLNEGQYITGYVSRVAPFSTYSIFVGQIDSGQTLMTNSSDSTGKTFKVDSILYSNSSVTLDLSTVDLTKENIFLYYHTENTLYLYVNGSLVDSKPFIVGSDSQFNRIGTSISGSQSGVLKYIGSNWNELTTNDINLIFEVLNSEFNVY